MVLLNINLFFETEKYEQDFAKIQKRVDNRLKKETEDVRKTNKFRLRCRSVSNFDTLNKNSEYKPDSSHHMRSLSNSSIGSKADQALASFRLSRHNQCQKKNCTGCHLTRLIQPKEYTFICGNPEVQNLKTSKDTSKYTTEGTSTHLEQVKSVQQNPVKSKKHSNPYKKSVDLNDLKFFKT